MARKPDESSNDSAGVSNISTILADQSPLDLASVTQNTDLEGLRVSTNAIPIPTVSIGV